jgi:hypothetical protein
MRHDVDHLRDEDLLLAVDGELTADRRYAVDAHLSRCDWCRARLTRFGVIGVSLVSPETPATAATTDGAPVVADPGAARERLALALAVAADQWARRSWTSRAFAHVPSGPRWALAAAASFAVLLLLRPPAAGRGPEPTFKVPELDARPIASLTPGATREMSGEELCGNGPPPVQEIASSVRAQVLGWYGMAHVPPAEYELDYLITPELGGAPDARNLWPQRYGSRIWNARVKDELEELLPTLVCGKRVDLATAQREIAMDWIAAYRKYFQSDDPVRVQTRLAGEGDVLVFGLRRGPSVVAKLTIY